MRNMSGEDSIATSVQENSTVLAPQAPREYKLVYPVLITLCYGHLAAIYGLYLCFSEVKWATLIFGFITFTLAEIGVTAGAHRLWSHKAYKAKLPLQILLMLMHSMAYQYTVIEWVENHRLHHKYSDTDADPHNAGRGFFFSHIGWILTRTHPNVEKKRNYIDISDILNNPVLKFQKKYALPLINVACFVLPTVIPVYCWEETWRSSWHITVLRYILNLNVTFFINSAAHMWGNKPYDINILPVQNLSVSFFTFGEGFHNYHHAFPLDYRAAELGNNYLNLTTKFIDFFAKIGWAYDLRTVSEDMIIQRAKRTGDGSNHWDWYDDNLIKERK